MNKEHYYIIIIKKIKSDINSAYKNCVMAAETILNKNSIQFWSYITSINYEIQRQ